MFKIYFILLLFCHLMGDFYLQNEYMAVNKGISYKMLILHCIIYGGIMCFVTGLVFGKVYINIVLLVILSHFAVDFIKSFILNKYRNKTADWERNIYITDQILHLLFLGVCAYVIKDYALNGPAVDMFNNIGINKICFLKVCTLILLMHKPSNITIKRLIEGYKPLTDSVTKENKKTGAIIGTLERYIILILLFLGQYSAIGLVLTAKSIARYKELENKDFAEYYLIGTLMSTLIVIAAYLLIGR